ncbi:MAG: hypothetical protein KDA96_19530, partial [Planctomycetaceae bacterium]|nr:hypothetical protein [Planctomycetaceae bacterium]
SLVRNYVARHFALRTQVSGTSRIHWHGEELEFRDYWIYFEVECESPPTEHPASESPSTNRKSASELQAQLRPQETQLAPLLERVPSAESEAPEAVNGSARPILRPQTPREMPAPDAAPNAASANTNRWTGLHIRNSLLTENRPQQVNYVTLRMNEQILSLHLTSEKPECDVGSLVAAGQHTRGKQAEEFRHPTVPSDNR